MKVMTGEIVEAYHAIKAHAQERQGVRWAYGMTRNLKRMEPIVQSVAEAEKATPEFLEYEKARVELAKEHADKDEKGRPITNGQSFQIADQEAFSEALMALQEEHKPALEARQKQVEEVQGLLGEDVEYEPFLVSIDDAVGDVSGNLMEAIFFLIKDDGDQR